MTTPCIITVAVTGSLPRKKDHPALPITARERIASTPEAFEAAATLVPLQARNDDASPTSDPERFARVRDCVRKHCPGIVTPASTRGRPGAGRVRGGMQALAPEVGAFDAPMIFPAVRLQNAGRIEGALHIRFIMGAKIAMTVERGAGAAARRPLRRVPSAPRHHGRSAPAALAAGSGVMRRHDDVPRARA